MDDTYITYVNNETGVANIRHHDGDTGVSTPVLTGQRFNIQQASLVSVLLNEAYQKGCEKTFTEIKRILEHREAAYVRARSGCSKHNDKN